MLNFISTQFHQFIKRFSIGTLLTITIILCVAGLSVTFMLLNGRLPPAALVFLLLLSMGLSVLIATYMYWRRIDEAAREAHKTAWLWGGASGGGLLIGLVWGYDAGYASARPEEPTVLTDRLLAFSPIENPFMAGCVAVFLAQLLGYAIWWSFWWLAKR